MPHRESHRVDRIGGLRAAVPGANDGIVSTASLIVGVAAAESSRSGILVAGFAGMVAGTPPMAAGEHVSAGSWSDSEELAQIHVRRGFDPVLAGRACAMRRCAWPSGARRRRLVGQAA